MAEDQRPLVSIIIPTYNGEQYVADTLRSVLGQTHDNIQIIVIDDASSDNTLQVLKSFSDTRITLHENQQNQGLAKNLNAMAELNKGEFCIFLGQDDILQPEHVEKVLGAFVEPDIVLVHCNAKYIDENGGDLETFARDNALQIYKNQDPLRSLSFENYIQSCGMMFRRDAFLQSGGWDEDYHLFGEWLWYVKMAQQGRFGFCSSVLPSYRKHAGSTIQALKRDKAMALFLYHTRCRFYALGFARLYIKDSFRFYACFLLSVFKLFKT